MRYAAVILACLVLLPSVIYWERRDRRERRIADAMARAQELVRQQREKNQQFLNDLLFPVQPRVRVLASGNVYVRASCPVEAAEIVSQSQAFAWRSE